MDDQNKVCLSETGEKILIDFGDICRFCLTETKSDISINDKCLHVVSEEMESDTIFNFMTKLKFIKMEAPDTFPTHVCGNCFQLIQICFNFSQLSKKSESFLMDYYRNNVNETYVTETKISIKDPNNYERGNHTSDFKDQNPEKTLSLTNEINKTTITNLVHKLKESVCILETYSQKFNLFSGKIKKVQLGFDENENSKSGTKSEQLMYSCSQCLLKFSSLGALNFHYFSKHGLKKFKTMFKFQCKNCVKSFRDQENLRRHYRTIHEVQEIPVECLNIRVKKRTSIKDEKRKFFCFQCVPCKEFYSQDKLLQHFDKTHQNKESTIVPNAFGTNTIVPKLYACAYCNDLTFSSRVSVNEHLFLVHKLKDGDITKNDVRYIREDPKVFISMKPAPPTTPQGDTQLSALLEVLNSVVDSLSAAQQGRGFKILCKNCSPPSEFRSANDFAQHIRTYHDESKLLESWASKNSVWTCSECPATYSRKQTLCSHMREKHKQDLGGMKCPEPDCQETFASNRQLIQHGITAHQKYFAYFHKVFKKILQPHAEEEANRAKNFECDVCQRKYIYKSSLRKHILTTHLGKSAKQAIVCPYCGKTISSKLNLKSHIEFVHEALFVCCPICKKKINFRTIGKHYKTHRTCSDAVSSGNSFLCNLCGKILKSKRSFEDHQKLHKNIRDELCDVCGSGFTSKKFLRLHKKTHEGVQRKVFTCDQCDKVFSGRHTLNRHLLTHSGEKNFICEICSKCFYTLQELNRHVRYHKKEYRFDCQLCEMRFLDKSRFRHHMMRHRNIRPHKCQFCEKMFIVRGKMNLHMATKHNFEVRDTKGVWKDPKTYVPLDDLL